jgi:hypothetical protein
MKSVKFSQIALIVGLVVGLTALWAAAAPVGVAGDLITGGWSNCTVDGVLVAATYSPCDPCAGTLLRLCSEGDGYYRCTGGNIVVVQSSTSGHTPHPSGGIPVCSGPGPCPSVHSGTCY